MSAAARYETVLLTPEQRRRLIGILREVADRKNAGKAVGLLKSEPGLGGRVRWIFDDAEQLLAALESA